MSGKGGRPKGGEAKQDTYNKELPVNMTKGNADETNVVENLTRDEIRNAIQEMLTGNVKNLPKWLEEIGKKDPKKAMDIFQNFAEYVLPKQQRADSKTDGSQPIIINFEPSSKNIMPEIPKQPIKENIPPTPKKFNIDEILQ